MCCNIVRDVFLYLVISHGLNLDWWWGRGLLQLVCLPQTDNPPCSTDPVSPFWTPQYLQWSVSFRMFLVGNLPAPDVDPTWTSHPWTPPYRCVSAHCPPLDVYNCKEHHCWHQSHPSPVRSCVPPPVFSHPTATDKSHWSMLQPWQSESWRIALDTLLFHTWTLGSDQSLLLCWHQTEQRGWASPPFDDNPKTCQRLRMLLPTALLLVDSAWYRNASMPCSKLSIDWWIGCTVGLPWMLR